jgi:hypothetical protein
MLHRVGVGKLASPSGGIHLALVIHGILWLMWIAMLSPPFDSVQTYV